MSSAFPLAGACADGVAAGTAARARAMSEDTILRIRSTPVRIPRLAALHRGKPMPADRCRDDAIAEAGDERPALGDRLLDLRKRERGVVTGLAIPRFGNPDRVRVARVLRQDVAEAAGHLAD